MHLVPFASGGASLRLLVALSPFVGAQADADEALATSLASYLEARTSTEGLDEARAALEEQIALLATDDEDPLLHQQKLGRALWQARAYGKQRLRKGKVTNDTFERGRFDERGMSFAYWVPKKYDPEEQAYPLILAIPGADETPAEHLRSSWILSELRDGAILICPEMPEDKSHWDQLTVGGLPGGLTHVLTGLRIATERFAVDFDRIYVAGRGHGVPAAIAAGNYSPQRFAGIIGRTGDAGDQGPENYRNLPTYFTGLGAKAKAFRAAVEEAGFDNCEIAPSDDEEALWHWILAHPRESAPPQVKLVVGTPFPTRVNWLRVAPLAPKASASGTIERDNNTIRITAEGVSHVTLYLNDSLVDLEEPLQVVFNEVEHSVTLARSTSRTLDLIYDGTSDPANVYVAEASFAAPAVAENASFETEAEGSREFEENLAASEGRVEELWELHLWCQSNGHEALSPRVLRRILRLDPDHEQAHRALGHGGRPGQWFASAEEFERFLLGQEKEAAEARGYVLNNSIWIHPDERTVANKGWEKDHGTGQWLSGGDRRRLERGWVRQDLEWIPKDEAHHVDDGLWKVGDDWLELWEANRVHGRIDSMWHIPRAEVLVHATTDRSVALRAAQEMGRAIQDLRRVLGAQPALPLEVVVLRDEEQYDRFAFGDPDGRRPATDVGRMHVVHSAYFAESWFPRAQGKREFKGMGVCYWDTLVPNGDLFGVHAARLAVGLSYVEALDPSPKAVRKALSKGPGKDYFEAYQAEKKLPSWLRWGAAVYGERYFYDTRVAEGDDPWWTRAWSVENLKNRGGLRSMADLFAFRLDPSDRDDGLKLLLEAGLVVAFIVDGECEPVQLEHEKLKKALVAGAAGTKQAAALADAVLANVPALRAFAGL